MTSESAIATSAAPTRVQTAPRPGTELLRTSVTAVLFALLVTWMFSAWWSAPRASDVAELDRALVQGEVTGYQRASGLESSRALWGGLEPSTDQRGGMIVWQTTSGRTFYAEPDLARDFGPSTGFEDGGRRHPIADETEQRLQAAGVFHVVDQGATPLLATLLLLLGLFVLINGAAPQRGTRWFWFWVGGITAGLGVLAWLLLERVWRPKARPPGKRRMSGWQGVGLLILGSLLPALVIGDFF